MNNRPWLHCLLLLLALAAVSCTKQQEQSEPQPSPRIEEALVSVPEFDSQSAFKYLTTQTDFGPRNPGSQGHRACLTFLQTELSKYAEAVTVQNFSGADYKGKQYQLTNVVSSFNLQATDRILLTAHWDTRPWADEDANTAKHNTPVLGANDGASGVAVMLEIARVLKQQPPPIGVDIVLFDGEDIGKSGSLDTWCLGSKHFARTKATGFNPRFAINIDMIGDKMLAIPREEYSEQNVPDVVNMIFSIAGKLNLHQFADKRGSAVYDDHIPLNDVGIRAVDLIDFNYPDETNRYWHTTEDTPDKCSAESLGAVGKVLLYVIYSKAQM
ncbi:MAG: M28 family peptidase [Ignavibacteriae bacterium]|nr:M28 family peptidase [Ignavibacteriota bacterium]